MRLTVLGSGPAAPQPDTPASGLLVEDGSSAILLDCGQGVASRLVRYRHPRDLAAIVIGHFHADHYLDLSALRYGFAWGTRTDPRLPVYLPPDGAGRLSELAREIDERPTFFEDAFDVREYDPAGVLRVGRLELEFVPGAHYVPAWGVRLTDRTGARLVYAGDTGPNPPLVEAARAAELLVCEATLADAADDDPVRRGHLCLEETLAVGLAAGVARLLVTHYPSDRREALEARIARSVGVRLARPGHVERIVRAERAVLSRDDPVR